MPEPTKSSRPASKRGKQAKVEAMVVQTFSVAPEFSLDGADPAAVTLTLGLGDSDGNPHALSVELTPASLDNLVQQLQHARRMAWPDDGGAAS